MRIPTEGEVCALLGWGDDSRVAITPNGDGGYTIEARQMYEYLPLTFAGLSALSEFSGTKQISDSRWSEEGCETCDYGSSYEITITVRPEEGK